MQQASSKEDVGSMNPYESPEIDAEPIRRPRKFPRSRLIAASFAMGGVGVLLLPAGVAYWLFVLGIPPQDPDPEQIAYSNFHGRVGAGVILTGLVLIAAGMITVTVWAILSVTRRMPQKRKYEASSISHLDH